MLVPLRERNDSSAARLPNFIDDLMQIAEALGDPRVRTWLRSLKEVTNGHAH